MEDFILVVPRLFRYRSVHQTIAFLFVFQLGKELALNFGV